MAELNENKLNEGADNQPEKPETSKTYTEEEVQEMLQREADRRVTEALKKAEKKNAEKVKEAQKLAEMNEQQKFEYQLEQREKAIAEKEKALSLAENKNEAGKILSEKGLSLSLVDFVVAEDAEDMMSNIKLLETEFKKSVKAEVEKRLGGDSPKKNLPPDEQLTKEAFYKMSLTQQQELFVNNPELYKSLV